MLTELIIAGQQARDQVVQHLNRFNNIIEYLSKFAKMYYLIDYLNKNTI